MPKHPSASQSPSHSQSLSPQAHEPHQSSSRFEFGSNSYSDFHTASQSPEAQQRDDDSHSPSANASASGSGLNSTSRPDTDNAASTGQKNVGTKAGKRRYAASCEACRRRKRRCDGKGENGESLCKFCPQAGIQCVFPRCVASRYLRHLRPLTGSSSSEPSTRFVRLGLAKLRGSKVPSLPQRLHSLSSNNSPARETMTGSKCSWSG